MGGRSVEETESIWANINHILAACASVCMCVCACVWCAGGPPPQPSMLGLNPECLAFNKYNSISTCTHMNAHVCVSYMVGILVVLYRRGV